MLRRLPNYYHCYCYFGLWILLPLPAKCRDYRCNPLRPVYLVLGSNAGISTHQASTRPTLPPQLGRDQIVTAWKAAEQEASGWTSRLSRVCVWCKDLGLAWPHLVLWFPSSLSSHVSPSPVSLLSDENISHSEWHWLCPPRSLAQQPFKLGIF